MLAIPPLLAVLAGLAGLAGARDDDGRGAAVVETVAVARDDHPIVPTPVLDRLMGGDVLDVSVIDGTDGANGVVRQCTRTVGGVSGCTNQYPVQFDDRGHARFQYELTDPGDCGPAGSCVLVVDDLDGQRQALAVLVFGAPAPPPPAVTITPAELVEEGDRVGVDIAGLQPYSIVRIGYCNPECASATMVVADSRGHANATVVVGAPCGTCGIAVIGSAHDTLAPVPFTPALQPSYHPRRLAIGLLLAAALLAAAWRISAGIDWRPPSEADTPDLDAAEL